MNIPARMHNRQAHPCTILILIDLANSNPGLFQTRSKFQITQAEEVSSAVPVFCKSAETFTQGMAVAMAILPCKNRCVIIRVNDINDKHVIHI